MSMISDLLSTIARASLPVRKNWASEWMKS